MKFRRARKSRLIARLDMTPLVDCVLLLLLFFMLASTFTVRDTINIRMATAPGTKAFDQKDLSVTLAYGEGGPDGGGPIYVNDVEVKDMDELSRILTEAQNERPDLMLLIRPDARIESGRLIEVLGIANSAGIEQYGLAARPPG